MALSMKSASAVRPTVRVQAAKPGVSAGLLAAMASATLLLGGVQQVQAGVVLSQPKVKRVLQSDGSPPKPKEAAAPKAKKTPEPSEQTGGLSAQTVALPAALVVIGGGTFAISKLDEGFFEFMETTSAKNSGLDGAGYEEALKSGALAAGTGRYAGSKKGGKGGGGGKKGGGGGATASGDGGLGDLFSKFGKK